MLLLEYGANPNSGIIHVSTCGDLEMLAAILDRGAEPNTWLRSTTPLLASVKSFTQPYEKVVSLLRHAANPNFVGKASDPVSCTTTPAVLLATQRRDYRMVRILLGAGADINQASGDDILPNALFFVAHWGEIELLKIFLESSKFPLDLGKRKITNETVLDVAEAAQSFSKLKKPKHISKLPLPSRPPAVYERLIRILEEYAAKNPFAFAGSTLTTATPASPISMTAFCKDAAGPTQPSSFSFGASPLSGVTGDGI